MFFFLSPAWDNEKLLSPCEEEILGPHDNLHVFHQPRKREEEKTSSYP